MPTKLINTTTNQIEEVQPDQIEELVRSGNYRFAPGKRIEVVSPSGDAGTVDASEASNALNQGYVFDTPETKAERKINAEYADKPIQAGLAGLARGATAGLSDPILTGVGIATPEHLRRLDENNPVISGGAEAAGFVGSLFTPIGTGKAIIGTGKLAEKAVAKTLANAGVDASKSMAKKILAKGAETAAGGATEGALMGIGNVLSEDALGRAELNAENLMAGAGEGALFGAPTSVLFKGLAHAVPATAKAVKSVGTDLKNRAFSLEKTAFDAFEITNAEAGQLSKRGITPTKFTDKVIKDILPEAGDDIQVKFNTRLQKESDELATLYPEADRIARDVGVTIDDVYQPQKYIKYLDDQIANNASHSFASEMRGVKALKRDLVEGNFGTSAIDNPYSATKSILDKVDDLARFEKGAVPTKTQEAARDLRRMIREDINTSMEALAEKSADPAAKKLLGEARKMNDSMHTLLEMKKYVDKLDVKKATRPLLGLRDMAKTALYTAGAGPYGLAAAMGEYVSGLSGAQLVKLRLLSKMENANVGVGKRIGQAIDQFVSRTPRTAQIGRLAATKGLTEISFNPDEPHKKDKDKQAAFKRISDELGRITNPANQEEILGKRLEVLAEAAPYTALHLAPKMVNAAQFLMSKAPYDPGAEKSLNPLLRKWKPSDAVLSKFERYVRAVNDPVGVIERFGDGIVDREGVEVLANVYPEIYEDFREKVLAKVSEQPEQLSYKKRLELRNILDLSVDPSTSPQSVKFLQATFAQEDGDIAQQQGSAAKTKGKLDMNMSNVATDTQNTQTLSELA
jgi:hypothetical protein